MTWNDALSLLMVFGPLPVIVVVVLAGRRRILLLPSVGFIVGGLMWVAFCWSEGGGEGPPPGPEAVVSGFLIGSIVATTYLAIGGPIVYAVRYFSGGRTSN